MTVYIRYNRKGGWYLRSSSQSLLSPDIPLLNLEPQNPFEIESPGQHLASLFRPLSSSPCLPFKGGAVEQSDVSYVDQSLPFKFPNCLSLDMPDIGGACLHPGQLLSAPLLYQSLQVNRQQTQPTIPHITRTSAHARNRAARNIVHHPPIEISSPHTS